MLREVVVGVDAWVRGRSCLETVRKHGDDTYDALAVVFTGNPGER